jgi:hypothetical protein
MKEMNCLLKEDLVSTQDKLREMTLAKRSLEKELVSTREKLHAMTEEGFPTAWPIRFKESDQCREMTPLVWPENLRMD